MRLLFSDAVTVTAIAPKCFSFTLCQSQVVSCTTFDKLSTFFLFFLFVFNQAKTSSLLSAEMTNTVIRMKKKDLSFHVGLEGRSPHSFKKSSWMEERALFFLGTKNTEQFTRKRCCISLIQTRGDRNLNINQNITRKNPALAEAKTVKQKTRIRLNINTRYATLS